MQGHLREFDMHFQKGHISHLGEFGMDFQENGRGWMENALIFHRNKANDEGRV